MAAELVADDLRHLVEVQRWVKSDVDEHGQPEGAWRRIATCYAALQPVQGRWAESARQLFKTTTHNIVIRYNAEVTINDRVVWGTRIFAIGHITDHDERHAMMRLFVAEVRE